MSLVWLFPSVGCTALTWRTTPAQPALLFLQFPPVLSRPLYPCLPHLFLHFSHLDSILGFLFTASVFQSPVLSLFLYSPSPAAPSITHSLLLTSPSPCHLLSVCPCSVSPLAHLSLSPCAYCHHAQCPPTRLTPLFLAFCLLSLSFFLFPYFYHALYESFPILIFDHVMLCDYCICLSDIWTAWHG